MTEFDLKHLINLKYINRKISSCITLIIFLIMPINFVLGEQDKLADIVVSEQRGIPRKREFVEIPLQLPVDSKIGVYDEKGPVAHQCIFEDFSGDDSTTSVSVIFPVSIDAHVSLHYRVIDSSDPSQQTETDLKVSGEDYDLIVENQFYVADLTRHKDRPNKNHESGQLCELIIKMGLNQRLFRSGNRMHWAPNFKRSGAKNYRTIAHWERPHFYRVDKGPLLVRTQRKDSAADYPEIELSAMYKFYSGVPYFKFFSRISFHESVLLILLRNDEMTMDSLFTNVAFERPDGQISNLDFNDRYEILKKFPVENRAPWLCFYNRHSGYGFGSIRLMYDIRNKFGEPSPTLMPHTKISDGAGGGKYWNRRLIHDKSNQPVWVPMGSIYREENAYVVFKIDDAEPWQPMKEWAEKLRHPLRVDVIRGDY